MPKSKTSSCLASPALSEVFARLQCELNVLQSAIQTSKARAAAALATVDQDIDAAKRLTFAMPTGAASYSSQSPSFLRRSLRASFTSSHFRGSPIPVAGQGSRHVRMPTLASDSAGRFDALDALFGLSAEQRPDSRASVPRKERVARRPARQVDSHSTR